MISLGVACQDWNTLNENDIPTSVQNQVLVCPPTETRAIVNYRFREEELMSAFGGFDTGYAENAMKLYYPGARVCYNNYRNCHGQTISEYMHRICSIGRHGY